MYYLTDSTLDNFPHLLDDQVKEAQAGRFQPIDLFFGHHVEGKVGREQPEPHTCRSCAYTERERGKLLVH